METQTNMPITQVARILVLDDDATALRAFEAGLRDDEVTIVSATSPEEALRILERESFDVVISDYCMPHMTGGMFLDRVSECAPDAVRILISGHGDHDLFEDLAHRSPIFRFLQKPVELDTFRTAVSDAIEQHRVRLKEKINDKKNHLCLTAYKQLFRNAFDPMMIADLNGNIVEVNNAFVRKYGDDRHVALRKRPHLLSHHPSPTYVWTSIRHVLINDGHWMGRIREEQQHYLIAITAIRDDNGVPFALAATERPVKTKNGKIPLGPL